MIFATLKTALDSLRHNTLRSVLTALGIIIGTAMVVIMLSVGQGVRALILNQLSDITPETLYIEVQVPSTSTGVAQDTNTAGGIGGGIQIQTMKHRDLEDVLAHPNIEAGYAMNIGQAKFQVGNIEKTTTIFAVGASYGEVESLGLTSGRFYSDTEDRSLSQVLVLGSEIAVTLFRGREPVGQSLKVNGQNFKVVGVAEEIGTQFFLPMDEIVYIPNRTAQKKVLGLDYIQAMSLKMVDRNLIDGTIRDLERIMRRNHNIKDPEKDDFVVRTMEESMEIVDTVTGGISLLLIAIASISLVVGGVGIMNIMYVAVTERTKEIGLRKAVGAKPWVIKLQFLAEAVYVSAIGGVLGVLIGIFISWLVSFIAGLFNFEWPFVMTFDIALFAFSISLVLGIIFGYAPANQAANLNPIDSIRKN